MRPKPGQTEPGQEPQRRQRPLISLFERPLRQPSRAGRFRHRSAAYRAGTGGRRLLERIAAIGQQRARGRRAWTYPLPFAPLANAGYDTDLRDRTRILAVRRNRLAKAAIKPFLRRREPNELVFAVKGKMLQVLKGLLAVLASPVG